MPRDESEGLGRKVKTLYIERSAGAGRDGGWVEELDLEGVDRIVVGTGPGSFAGVRSAIAFAKGFALGRQCEVLGLPSPCAVAAQALPADGTGRLAVVGDARCGKLWVALFDGWSLAREIFQTVKDDLRKDIPDGYEVVTTDEARIGALLKETFGTAYRGGIIPTDKGLRAFAEKNPDALAPDPLPIYLNPAVRSC